jgi:hypothetical protein
MDAIHKRQIMDNAIIIKDVFGSHKILDEFEPWDIPAVIEFAKIVFNYKAINESLNENENNSLGNVAQ